MQSIFTASEVDLPLIEAAIAEGETLNVEWKSSKTPEIAKSVAAFANTHGGVVLVGVDNNGTIRGIARNEVVGIAQSCSARLDPPFEPEVLTVSLGEPDRVVLVLRVDAELAPRPIVVDGRVYVRLQGRNVPADRYRIEALFAERRYPEATAAEAKSHPQFWWGGKPVLVMQTSVHVPLTASHIGGLFVTRAVRDSVLAELEDAEALDLLKHYYTQWPVTLEPAWRPQGVNDRNRFAVGRALVSDTEPALDLQFMVEQRAHGVTLSVAAVQHDLKIVNEVVPRHEMAAVGLFFTSSISTIHTLLGRPVSEWISPATWRPWPPFARILTPDHQPLRERLLVSATHPNNNTNGCDFACLPDVPLDTHKERTTIVRDWIEQMLLDMGVVDVVAHKAGFKG